MKSKVGIFMVLLCVVSFFLYSNWQPPKGEAESFQASLIEGIVVSKSTDKPLEGVWVGKRGYNPTASTDQDGHFYIEAKESDELMLKLDGYEPLIVSAKETKKILMTPLPEKKEENLEPKK